VLHLRTRLRQAHYSRSRGEPPALKSGSPVEYHKKEV
jgi:hypothetical protein